MISIKFYLKNPKGNTSSIFFRFHYGAFKIVDGKKKYLPMQYHTDETINPEYWNKKKGEAKQVYKFPQYMEFNARLNNTRDAVLTVYRRLLNDNADISNDILRKEFDLIFKKHRNQTINRLELMQFIPYFLETCNKTENTKTSYRRVLTDLQEYEQSRNIVLTFDRIDIDFHDSFIQFLQSKKYAPNTIGTRIKILKTFMNVAYERNLHTNLDFKKRAFDKPKEETASVYLNEKELEAIYRLDYSNNNTYDHVRDWFLIAAYTGLRFSDLQRLTRDDIQDGAITSKTVKTGSVVSIPLHTIVKSILEKYDYTLPKLISSQTFNVHIKEVAKAAGINEPVIVEETRGNLKSKATEKKYKLVSAHTARRSFATNAYLNGVPAIQIMKMTGHKSEKTFLGYIKISASENAKKLQLHPFFNKMIVK